jgi:hypothetical protein
MGIARHRGETYSVEPAETAAERALVYALREEQYRASQPYLLTQGTAHPAADLYDDRSYVFACTRAGDVAPVATCRFTVPLKGRFELDDLATGWARPPVPAHQLVETSRVVVRKDCRATGLVEAMLLLAGTWMLEQTAFRYNFAVCARPLVRLYARLGMQLVGEDEIELLGRPRERGYVVIYGDMKTSQPGVLRRLVDGGWDLASSPVVQRKAGT